MKGVQEMAIQKYKPEQIVRLLRQAEGVRRIEGGAGEADEGTGEGEYAAEAADRRESLNSRRS